MQPTRDIKSHKRKFDAALRHIKVILMNQKAVMRQNEWIELVKDTERCICEQPEDFLGGELAAGGDTIDVIKLVFEGFRRDNHIRNVQSFRDAKVS